MMETAARWGLAARGTIYVLVGVAALRIAFGEQGRQADRGGALAELSGQPFGSVLVWVIGIGLAGMALWRLSEAVAGQAGADGRKATKRLASAGRFLFYAFVSFSVITFALSGRNSSSSDKQSKDVTARVLDLPAGQWLVGIAGAVIACAGVWIAARAVMRSFHKRLKLYAMSPRQRKVVDVLGMAGGVCRGIVFTVAGGFAVQAALEYDPKQAKGLDDTLRTFAETPAGPWLLAAVAAGFVLFGAFSWAMARWRRF
jgi:hypothetical protein